MKQQNKQAYTIIVVILIIGFLLVLTIGILKLVMDEMKDNASLGNYQKAYVGAESAQELALLQIKEKGYGYNENMEEDFNRNMFAEDINNPKYKEVKLDYKNNGSIAVNSNFEATLEPLENAIIPLFTITNSETDPDKTTNITLDLKGNPDVSWNVVSNTNGIANTGANTITGIRKGVSGNNLTYGTETITSFLGTPENKTNYLMLFNASSTTVDYKITSTDKAITKPIIDIVSTAEVGGYKQNIETKLNFAEMNSRAKYTIYSQ